MDILHMIIILYLHVRVIITMYLFETLKNIHKRAPSVAVREEWKVLEDGEMDFPRLSKLNLPSVGEPDNL